MMNLQAYKYHKCAQDECEGILLVDVETEEIPRKDVNGNWMYYCQQGHHFFAVKVEDKVVQAKVREIAAIK